MEVHSVIKTLDSSDLPNSEVVRSIEEIFTSEEKKSLLSKGNLYFKYDLERHDYDIFNAIVNIEYCALNFGKETISRKVKIKIDDYLRALFYIRDFEEIKRKSYIYSNPVFKDIKDNHLILCIQDKNIEMINFFIKMGVDINHKDEMYRSECLPLFEAIRTNDVKIVDVIIKAGANINVDHRGKHFIESVMQRNLEMIKLLLSYNPVVGIKQGLYITFENIQNFWDTPNEYFACDADQREN